MASAAEDAVQQQDDAVERFLPVALDAITAADTPAALAATPPPPPPGLKFTVKAAILSTLIAVIASHLDRPSTEVRLERPAPDDVQIEKVADAMTPGLVKETWGWALHYVRVGRASFADEVGARQRLTDAQRENYARALARTLATRSAAESTLATASLLDMGYKVWLTRGDPRVRMSHRRLHGHPVPMDKPFRRWPSGQVLDFPGDPRAPIREIAGCRCFLFVAPSRSGIVEALGPADLDKAFALAAALDQRWEDS